MSALVSVIKDAYIHVKRYYTDPLRNYPAIVEDDAAWNVYVDALSEGLREQDIPQFKTLLNNVREFIKDQITANSYSPYQMLMAPVLRVYFPRLIAKEAVTTKVMDVPDMLIYIMRAYAKTPTGQVRELPSYEPVSYFIESVEVQVAQQDGQSATTTVNLLDAAQVPASLREGQLNAVERHVVLVSATNFNNSVATINQAVQPQDGSFRFEVVYEDGTTDTLVGAVDFKTGDLTITSKSGHTKKVVVQFQVSQEGNQNVTEIEFKLEPLKLQATKKQLRARWSNEAEQDFKALFNIDLQAALVQWIGDQIALDVDRQIVNELISYATAYKRNDITFSKTPPSGFAFGPQQWYQQFIVYLNEAGSRIYNDTNLGYGNVVLMNPVDATIVQSLDIYSAEGWYSEDMTISGQAVQVGNLQGQYKVLISPVVPQGKAVVIYKDADERKAVYIYGMYRPLEIIPWPYGPIPSMSMFQRDARAMIRPKGIYVINIT